MPSATSAKPGGFRNAKIGPVPVPLALAAVVAVGVYLYVRHRASTAKTSAGSNATPETAPTSLYPTQPDSTGGGSGGLDLSSLLDLLSQQAATIGLLSVPAASSPPPLPSSDAPTDDGSPGFSFGALSSPTGGANVSPQTVAAAPTRTDSSFVESAPYAAETFNPPDYGPDAGYTPAGTETLAGSIIAPTTTNYGLTSPGGGVYTSGGGNVTYQSNKGKYGKKPLL